ncbi:exodeoxyribonuclease VII large subunit [Bacillus sp. DTU_2020_1000418_1_SI_GHA_SEK_038]|uniref:exodeoxyribonuclease VII large subunit n=1 Tax=Bacillus sp. DTU_2020_1000418_1_SI_GHA_SEK_038 TaxID=3077585 RepID=UPI0028E7E285|nr:exodeoxyribonuclease VII large subunit [Bacillus sp. DTU_2020_1000418_1_SI_GHA_SEK_038]WNS74177.1 exodeoxyribonuclease VII large subunit [Bacillus sp. DTU_2020_1000418_1_SI_GHA_SEK_038]
MKDQRYLTVNALTKYIKRKFDADPHLQDVLVKGEISNFKQHSSGHMYFTLKDEKARVLAVMFSSNNRGMKFSPENGMKVLIRGDLTVYEPSGQYQIYIKEMHPDGIGDLYLAFEQLKERLEKEGIFSPQNKKPIPKFPKTVGIITSPTGAAIRDILTTIKRRYPVVNITIFPALVQGLQAAPSIVKQIQLANELNEADVLIIGRGGGSIEELWAFNEEEVAKAIFHSQIPIISAVGHETDFTIADFVADLRAPTPTGAAEMAVPHIEDLTERILNRESRLLRALKEQMTLKSERLSRIQKSYAFRYPQKLYEQKLEQVDRLTEQLERGSRKLFHQKIDEWQKIQKRMQRKPLNDLLLASKEQQEKMQKQLNKIILNILAAKEKDFSHKIATLEALNPLKIMDRGYSLVYTKEENLVKSVKQIKENDQVKIKVPDGIINCLVTEIEE